MINILSFMKFKSSNNFIETMYEIRRVFFDVHQLVFAYNSLSNDQKLAAARGQRLGISIEYVYS